MNYGCLFQLVAAFFKIINADSQLKARDRFFIGLTFIFICGAPVFCISSVASLYTDTLSVTPTRRVTPSQQNNQQQSPDAFAYTLLLDEVINDTFEEGQRVRLLYSDENSVVATLRIVVDGGDLPTVVQTTINRRNIRETVSITSNEDNSFQLCGYELQAEYYYSFSFEVPLTTFYKIEFMSGNTCSDT